MYPSLQGQEAIVVPGVHLGPRRQQHPAHLRVAAVRRVVQHGGVDAVRRGRGAGHRPQQVPDPPEVTAVGRREDVVVASEGHGPPPGGHRWQGRGHNGDPKNRGTRRMFCIC